MKKTISVALIRPFRMFAEPIVLAVSLFMAMVYAIFYLFFEAYPIIFGGMELFPGFTSYLFALNPSLKPRPGVYEMNTGNSALAFIPSRS